jgi:AMP-binding enzyme
VPASLVRKTIGLLGCKFSILFGQTETHGVISQTRVTDTPEDPADTVGQPLPRLEVKIADVATGEPVPVNEQGEICCRGYQNMQGYYNMPAETAATMDRDGWLHMGDIGSMDERGFLRVTGRVKDMIIRGGMNLYPAAQDPGVLVLRRRAPHDAHRQDPEVRSAAAGRRRRADLRRGPPLKIRHPALADLVTEMPRGLGMRPFTVCGRRRRTRRPGVAGRLAG